MIYQYNAQRFRQTPTGKKIGTIPVGTILYIQDGVRPFSMRQPFIRRNPWIVTAWLNREYHHPQNTKMMAGGHLAEVKSLRDGRTQRVADWILLRCIDAGLERF